MIKIFVWGKFLNFNGQLVLAHKNRHKYQSYLVPKWFNDWAFYPRDLNEILKIMKSQIEVTDNNIKIEWEKTGVIFLYYNNQIVI